MTVVTAEKKSRHSSREVEFATFYVGDLLIGIDICQVEEINRHLRLTPVPQAPECVRGVINLRGEVVTVVDLRSILGLDQVETSRTSRNVIVNSHDERIGMLVDSVADVVTVDLASISAPPANVSGIDGKYFQGVVRLEKELLVLLNVEAALAAENRAR